MYESTLKLTFAHTQRKLSNCHILAMWLIYVTIRLKLQLFMFNNLLELETVAVPPNMTWENANQAY